MAKHDVVYVLKNNYTENITGDKSEGGGLAHGERLRPQDGLTGGRRMSTLQKLQCDQCGGRIDRATLTCQSCGMQYRYEHETQELRIITEQRKTDILHERVIIRDELLHHNPEEAIEYTIKRIASDMARQLVPYIELERESDPYHQETAIYARVRVARPTSGGERT